MQWGLNRKNDAGMQAVFGFRLGENSESLVHLCHQGNTSTVYQFSFLLSMIL